MSAPSPIRRYTAAFVAIAMLGSTAAAAAPAAAPAPRMVDPLAVVSIFGTAESAAAICAGSSAATAAGTAAAGTAAATTAGQVPGTGCVLPMVDAAPPPVVEAAPGMLPPTVATTGGIAAFPLLAGLAAIVGLAAIILSNRTEDGQIDLPISP